MKFTYLYQREWMRSKMKRKMKSGAALKAAWKFSGLMLSLRPMTMGLGPRLRITPRGVAEDAGQKTAEPGGRSRRTNKDNPGRFSSHATCGGRRVNRARYSRAHPGPHSRGR